MGDVRKKKRGESHKKEKEKKESEVEYLKKIK